MDILFEDFKISNSIGYVINIVANKMKFELEKKFKSNGIDITPHQWMVLSIVCENEGICQNELSLKSKKDKTNVARILEKLENSKFVERVKSDKDKRVFFVYPTALGKEIREDLSLFALEVISKSVQNISEEEHKMCIDFLRKIYANLS